MTNESNGTRRAGPDITFRLVGLARCMETLPQHTWNDPRLLHEAVAAIEKGRELLAALKALYAATPDNEGGALGHACMIARAAIAKAEGGGR